MKTLILFILCFWLLPVMLVSADENPCWECYDTLSDCERGDGKECCKEAKKDCVNGCKRRWMYYQICMDNVDGKESYLENRTKGNVNKFRQRFMDEMDGMIE